MSRAQQTTRQCKVELDKFRLYKPFIFYIFVLASMHYVVIRSGSGTLSLAKTAALICAGLLTWGLYEYAVHRWVLHRELRQESFTLPGTLTHLRHHADPHSLQRLNVQLSESVPVCVVYCLLGRLITGSWQVTVHLFTGLIAGYFFYEYLDFQAHYGTSRTRLVRYFRKYHLQHHQCNARARYGVTSPLFDHLFGTFHLDDHRVTPNEEKQSTPPSRPERGQS